VRVWWFRIHRQTSTGAHKGGLEFKSREAVVIACPPRCSCNWSDAAVHITGGLVMAGRGRISSVRLFACLSPVRYATLALASPSVVPTLRAACRRCGDTRAPRRPPARGSSPQPSHRKQAWIKSGGSRCRTSAATTIRSQPVRCSRRELRSAWPCTGFPRRA